MKTLFARISVLVLATVALSSCIEMMKEAQDVPIVEPITVSYKVNAATGFIPKGGSVTPDPNFSTAGVKVTFTNVTTNQVYETETGADCFATADVDPGVYSIGISGNATFKGYEYFINGNVPSISLFKTVAKAEAEADPAFNLTVRPAKVGSLVLSEIYYCGAKGNYFRDQTYQIYNNGDETVYLDGVCLGQLYPQNATANLPVWPDEDGVDNFAYCMWVWQFPGSGNDYPLKPGQSVILAQEARDHTTNNENSFDNSIAEWECWTANAGRDNPNVANMPPIFYTNWNAMQWLSGVFGAAFCLFKIEGETVDADYFSKSGPHVQNEVNKTAKYAKIPADAILDGVELLTNSGAFNMKRVPGFIDAGGTSVDATYCGKTVSRKVIGTRADGTPILQDTNNSTDDFQVNEHPALRRNGEKAPDWRPIP